jgi:lactate dehydrogenase-like 2-hydroxyacid dehydrogenase
MGSVDRNRVGIIGAGRLGQAMARNVRRRRNLARGSG